MWVIEGQDAAAFSAAVGSDYRTSPEGIQGVVFWTFFFFFPFPLVSTFQERCLGGRKLLALRNSPSDRQRKQLLESLAMLHD